MTTLVSDKMPTLNLVDEKTKSAGLGQIVVSQVPDDTLVAYGLGSCVGVVGYDVVAKIGGILHALLPKRLPGETNEAKFVDTGIPALVAAMERLGAKRKQIVWYVVGGADMLNLPNKKGAFNIGTKNSEMARLVMAEERLPVKVIDVGGTAGRTVKLSVRDGVVVVRTLGQGERIIS